MIIYVKFMIKITNLYAYSQIVNNVKAIKPDFCVRIAFYYIIKTKIKKKIQSKISIKSYMETYTV